MPESQVEVRLATVEANVATIASNVAKLSETMEKHSEQTWKAIDSLTDRVTQPKVVNWGWIISAATLLIILVGATLAPIYSDLHELKNNSATIQQVEHNKSHCEDENEVLYWKMKYETEIRK